MVIMETMTGIRGGVPNQAGRTGHNFVIGAIAVPSIIVYVFGFPAILLLLLWKLKGKGGTGQGEQAV